MQEYKYRWFYAVGVCFCLLAGGYFTILQPQLTKMNMLQEEQKKNYQDLFLLKQSATPEDQSDKTSLNTQSNVRPENWDDVFLWAYKSGLSIQSFNLLAQLQFGQHHFPKIHLETKGNFLQLTSFLKLITENVNSSIIVVTDFSYRNLRQNKYGASMDLVMIKNSLNLVSPHLSYTDKSNNPFCSSFRDVMQSDHVNEIEKISLREMKMIGYLKQAQQASALVSSSSGNVFSIDLNAKIGLEQALVIDIQPHYFTVKLSENEKRVITMKDRE